LRATAFVNGRNRNQLARLRQAEMVRGIEFIAIEAASLNRSARPQDQLPQWPGFFGADELDAEVNQSKLRLPRSNPTTKKPGIRRVWKFL
jgi:hypothetical protein